MIALLIGISTGISIAFLSFKPFFPEEGEFCDAIKHMLTPDIISLFAGTWVDDFVATLKVNLWMLMCGGGAYITYCLANRIIG